MCLRPRLTPLYPCIHRPHPPPYPCIHRPPPPTLYPCIQYHRITQRMHVPVPDGVGLDRCDGAALEVVRPEIADIFDVVDTFSSIPVGLLHCTVLRCDLWNTPSYGY